jgi:hypothetical protein
LGDAVTDQAQQEIDPAINAEVVADPAVVAGGATPSVVTDGPLSQLIVLTVLIIFYSLIPLSALVDLIGQIASNPRGDEGQINIDVDGFLSLLGPISAQEGGVLEALHKLILPLAGLFVGFNFATLKRGRWFAWLFVVPLIGTIGSLVAAALLEAFATDEVRSDLPGVMTLFRDVASNLGIFLMLMIGISQSNGSQLGDDNG